MEPRSGTNPITNDTIVGPPGDGLERINGREYTIPEGAEDLQYACIFDLTDDAVKTCDGRLDTATAERWGSSRPTTRCAGAEAGNDRGSAPRSTTQIKAKAYPGLRERSSSGSSAPRASSARCARASSTTRARPDYGYRPAIGAIIDRLKTVLGGQCLPRTLTPHDNQQVSCLILEARNSQGQCNVRG